MDGVPVFLASTSRRDWRTGRLLFTPTWPQPWYQDSIAALRRLLGPLGDRSRERIFRMNLTLCVHRALTDEECARLPASFWEGDAEGIAGAPVAVLWENVPGALSTKPCAAPHKAPISGYARDPDGWIPVDCGICPSCLARAAA